MLVCWLIATLTEPVHSQVVRCKTSNEIWTTLAALYSSASTAQIIQLWYQLRQTKRGNSTIHQYLLTVKRITDQFVAYGKPLTDEELCLQVFEGLGPAYQGFVTAITTQRTPLQYNDLRGMLLTQEIHLKDDETLPNLFAPKANYVTNKNTRGGRSNYPTANRGGRNGGRGRYQGGRYPPNRNPSNNFGGQNSGSHSQAKDRGTNTPPVECQICNKFGH
ncbi:uncharacterized protein LOC122648640 [Telopea speciosissima]|uniref:uncharacterized protein LOC122648640 n=1 Tax=Telopea speciosissima TaxID=54955 RepID=UPI001CC7013E|nr:uncharacterized protein LOC122648640 [Telopea speciosissima]